MTDDLAMKPNGLYVPLDVHFASDDKLCTCSVDAEHVFIRSLALCKRTLSDGTVTMNQLRRECEKLDRAQLDSAVVELLSVGLYEGVGMDRIVIPSWLKRNPSKATLAEKRAKLEAKSRLGNHTRWHAERNVIDPTCEFCSPRSKGISPRESQGDSLGESIREDKIREDKISEANPGDVPPSDQSAGVVAGEIFRNAGFVGATPSRGEVQTVGRALARGWPADYLRNLGTEAAVKADTNPKGYIASALNRCANLELPPTAAPKPPGPLITCPECGGMARDYGPDGTLVDVDCKRCDNRRKVPLDADASANF